MWVGRRELDSEVVVLLDILSHDANFGYAHDGWRILTALNGQRVKSLRQLHQLWTTAASKPESQRFLEFAFHDETRCVPEAHTVPGCPRHPVPSPH